MKTLCVVIFLLMFSILGAGGQSGEADLDPEQAKKTLMRLDGFEDALKKIDGDTSHEKKLHELGILIRLVGEYHSVKWKYHEEKYTDLRDRLRQAIIGVSGHAQYFEKKIQLGGHDQAFGFQVLEQVPSPEVVRVLGEFLYDEKGKEIFDNPKTPEEAMLTLERPLPNCFHASDALANLIENAPAVKGAPRNERLEVWRHWYQQVKEGRRTFRFRGDPQEYDLKGPARVARNPDVPRANRRPAGDSETSFPQAASTPPSSFFGLVAGVVAVLFGGGYYIYRKKGA